MALVNVSNVRFRCYRSAQGNKLQFQRYFLIFIHSFFFSKGKFKFKLTTSEIVPMGDGRFLKCYSIQIMQGN